MKIKTIFFGTPHYVLPIWQFLKKETELVAVVTSPDFKNSRKKLVTPSPIAQASFSESIPVLKPEKLDPDFLSKLKNLNPDLIVVAAYGKILPQAVLNIPKYGALNIHPSLLPKYRGASPIQAAILAGDKETGVTIIKMDELMDHGPIVASQSHPILPTDTFLSLAEKLFTLGALLLEQILPDYLGGKIKLLEQDHSKATFCYLVKKQDGYFDLDKPPSPEILERMIRAFYPWPSAWTRWKGKVIKLLPNRQIQMEGKKPTSWEDFRNGYPDFPIERLLSP